MCVCVGGGVYVCVCVYVCVRIMYVLCNVCIVRGGSRRGSLGEAHTLAGGGHSDFGFLVFLVFVKPIF